MSTSKYTCSPQISRNLLDIGSIWFNAPSASIILQLWQLLYPIFVKQLHSFEHIQYVYIYISYYINIYIYIVSYIMIYRYTIFAHRTSMKTDQKGPRGSGRWVRTFQSVARALVVSRGCWLVSMVQLPSDIPGHNNWERLGNHIDPKIVQGS